MKLLHTADLHLDSAFEALGESKAAIRRSEQRELLSRLCELSNAEGVDILLMAGDILDGQSSFYETAELLKATLASINAQVFISPGNHDYYNSRSVYSRIKFSDNVHIFTDNCITALQLPELSAAVYGAAFTDRYCPALLKDFRAERTEGIYNILCLHGDYKSPASVYNPIMPEDVEASDFDYIALGHVHTSSELISCGSTYLSYSGAPEGRGFDECGDKSVNLITLSPSGIELEKRSIAMRSYRRLEVDITAAEPLLAILTALPDDTLRDIYRIVLTGECDSAPDLSYLSYKLAELFFHLQLVDSTHPTPELWSALDENSLRGLFLRRLYNKYIKADEEQKHIIEMAVRFGLSAINRGEEPFKHDN